MRALEYGKAITENVEELGALLKKATKPPLRRRLRFLLLLKQNKGMSRAVAGKKLGLLSTGAEEMWKLYKSGGLEKMMDYPFKGKSSLLDEKQKQWLKQELQKNTTKTLSEACTLVKEHAQIAYSVSAMHYVFKSLQIKKKTGRPSHIDKNQQKVETFKKKTFLH